MLFPRAAPLSVLWYTRRLLAGWLGLVLALGAPAHAEDPPRRVGSLNYISGEVNYALRAEGIDPGVLSWSTADFNQPVCQDMSLQTGPLARARIRIGSNAIQMAGDTLLDVLNLDDRQIEASLRQGRVHLQLRNLGAGESVEIEIPRGSLWVLQSGAYDIETPGAIDQPARITVFEGKARFVGGAADVPIGAGEEIRVTGVYPAIVTTQHVASGTNSVPTNPEPATSGAGSATVSPQPTTAGANPVEADGQPGPPKSNLAATNAQAASSDDFLSWVAPSDAGSSPRPSSRHASLEMTGYEELHPYGQWKTLDDYGPVWFPTSVPVEWAPYRFGHWTSISPWGWTWIDDQPWGFAPFHFGRWVRVDDRWAWAPGDSVDHPVYAPALVAFLETSGGLAATGPGEPPIGWFPLGPGDAYVPWFAAGPEYIQRVNVAYPGRFDDPAFRGRGEHGGKVWREEFANRRFATLMHREAFAYGRPVGREMIRMPADRLERAMVMRGAPRVTPAVMRTLAGPGGPHGIAPGMAAPGMAGPGGPHGVAPGMAAPGMAGPGGPHGIAPGMAAPGMAGPGGPHGVAPGMAGPGMAGPGGPRGVAPAMAAPGMAGPGGSHGVAPGMAAPGMGGSGGIGPGGANPRGFAGPGAPAVAAQMGRGVQPAPQQYGRQQVFQTPAPSYRPGAPQYGQPGVPRAPQMMGGRAPAMPARGAPSVAGRVAPQVAARPPPGGGGAPQQRPAPGGGGAAQHKK